MSEVLHALYKSEGAMGLLRAFGLHRVLTPQDDPALWAAALVRHWHAPGEADLQPAALRFGVGRPVPYHEASGVKLGRSGMEPLETWCFERADSERLRIVPCQERAAPSFMGMLLGSDPLAATAQGASWVRDYLEVSRPSLGERRALVHAGMSAPLNAGSGETRAWVRAEDGTWAETDEVLARWLA